MNIITVISSLKKAFSYFLRLRSRTLVYKTCSCKCNEFLSQGRSQLVKNPLPGIFKYEINGFREVEDYRQAQHLIIEGPQVVKIDGVEFQVLHRVAVRSVVQAMHTTESRELSDSEFELINTTHSSFIESEEQRLVNS